MLRRLSLHAQSQVMASLSPSNFHPTLSVPLPKAFLTTPSECEAYVLVSLPPALFADPWQAPISDAKRRARDGDNSSSGSTSQQPAGAIVGAQFLSAGGDGSGVELERAVGWTTASDRKRRPVSERRRGSGAAGAGDDAVPLNANAAGSDSPQDDAYEAVTRRKFVAGEGIVTETIKVLAQDASDDAEDSKDGAGLNVYSPTTKRNRLERETLLLSIATDQRKGTLRRAINSLVEVGSSGDSDDADAKTQGSDEEAAELLRLPLHARYLPPVDGLAESSPNMQSIVEHLRSLWPGSGEETGGNYLDVSVEGLEAFWACSKEQSGLQDGGSSDDAAWQKVTRASTLLPPSHRHLTSPLHQRLPHGSRLYRRTDLSTDDLSIQLPTGDASYAALTFAVTQSVFWMLAIALGWKLWRAK